MMTSLPGHARGAVLVVALILMLVITVLGVSGIGTAALELTMAGNAQSQQTAFQAAETGIDIAISQGGFAVAAVVVVPPTEVGAGETEAVTTFQQTTPVPDGAFSLGAGAGGVQAFHFHVVSVGRGPRGATSTHSQEFYVIGPGSD